MTSLELWQLGLILLGSAGIGGFVTSIVQSWIAWRKVPVETHELEANIANAISQAAEKLVASQAAVLQVRDAQVMALEVRVGDLEAQLQRVLNELETERALREEREHELERHRLEIAKQNARIGYLRRRVNAFMKALRQAGIDPDQIPIEEEDDG